MRKRQLLLLGCATALTTLVGSLMTAVPAEAHGAAMMPGSRTYLCYVDGTKQGGGLAPSNPACQAALEAGGEAAFYNWFAVLRSDGAGRMEGFIPDGKLCSADATVFDFSGFDQARSDWPVTHLTAGSTIEVRYNMWAAHPGRFDLYITKDGFDPNQPLRWDDLEDTPFSSVVDPPSTGPVGSEDGYYHWTAQLPSGKSGRHIIYSVWTRSDSQETFYGCSDVVFDGGNGEVTGIG